MGFMARLLALCTFPRTNPGSRPQYVRRNGPYTLYMIAGGGKKLPYGILPRLLLAWVCTEAVRTQSRTLRLGASLSAFMRKLGIGSDSGGARGDLTRIRNQMDRLFHATVQLNYEATGRAASVGSLVADRAELWWDERRPNTPVLWDSTIRLGEEFFNEIIAHPVPIDLHILKALKRSSLGVDLYLWLTYRTFMLKAPLRLSWKALYRQFGADPAKAGNPKHRERLSYEVPTRVDEDQDLLAGTDVPHSARRGGGRSDDASDCTRRDGFGRVEARRA